MENPGNRPDQDAWRFGLIGHPLAGSGSPALFAKAYGGRWPYDLIEGADFEASWQKFLDGYRAINITAPFKELAFAKVGGGVDPSCKEIGAINIAVKTPDGIRGYNSDFLGVRKVLLDEGFGDSAVCLPSQNSGRWNQKGPEMAPPSQESGRWERQLALVVGFGGAGKAAAAAAKSIGMDVVICNRTRRTPDICPLEEIPVLLGVADLLIYTLAFPLPILMGAPTEGARATLGAGPLIAKPKGFEHGTVLEANYRTPCMQAFGARYIPGQRWLEAQAVTGYPLMTGVELA
ncbi:MAG: hypothetical protein J5771_05180 [Bacteroidales bacterium]|nr:hypothetical protein [Bacteroidales bacterium]